MSAVLKLPEDGNIKNIYLIYDFTQIDDCILMVMYIDKLKAWKKFFVSYKNGNWNTNALKKYVNAGTCKKINTKLRFVFSEHDHPYRETNFNLEESMYENAEFILGLGS